jgi:hypothetical protein
MIVEKAPGQLDSLGIIGTDQRLEPSEMTVAPDGISPVLCHPERPLTDGAGVG